MSIASFIGNAGAESFGTVHDDGLKLLPADVVVPGYDEEVEGDKMASGSRVPQFAIAGDAFTHVVHIRRSKLTGVDLAAVNIISRPDGMRYRVRHFRNDTGRPEVNFFCTLA
jgi:hypothetical protein